MIGTKESRIDEKFGYTDLNGAVRITGLSKSKLYKLSANLEIPHYKPTGGKLIFKIQELLDFIEAGKQSQTCL